MNPHLSFAPRTFAARIAELGFTASLPADWVSHELPEEDVDFSDPTAFVPLAVLTAPHAAIVLAIAARPAHADGTLHDWAWYHLQHQQLQPRAVGRDVVSAVAAVSGEATQATDLGPMVVRFAFLEDGDRLVILTLTAPELFDGAVRDAWFELKRSFALSSPRGSRFALEPGADEVPAAPMPETLPDRRDSTPPAVLEADCGEVLHATRHETRALPDPAQQACSSLADLALSDDSYALDEDDDINRDVQHRGRGAVPEIAGLSDTDRCALLKARAIAAQITVPYGWHVADDGHRTLVFEPGGRVQLRLQRVPGSDEGGGPQGDASGLALVFQHAVPCPDPASSLRASAYALPEDASLAQTLARLVLEGIVFDDAVVEDDDTPEIESVLVYTTDGRPPELQGADGRPIWWHEALAMEAKGRLDAAEAHISANCPHIGQAASVAEMYRLRMLRLKARGDAAGALDAYHRASDAIRDYASMATSGAEGAALSLQRDEFLAGLRADYGDDPERRQAAAPAGA